MNKRKENERKLNDSNIGSNYAYVAIIFSLMSILLKFYTIYIYDSKFVFSKAMLGVLSAESEWLLFSVFLASILSIISAICFKIAPNFEMVVITLFIIDFYKIYLCMKKSSSIWEVIILSLLLFAFAYTWLDEIRGAKYAYYLCIIAIIVYLLLYMEVYGSFDFVNLGSSYFNISEFLANAFIIASYGSIAKAIYKVTYDL